MKAEIKKLAPKFLVGFYHYLTAFLGAVIYGFPSRKMTIIGVTGTKGKSTTVILAGKILEEAGFKVGWISSATIKVGQKEWLNPYHMTMPGRFVLQKLMRQMVNQRCQYCLVEVTSEGIAQYRHKFINFKTAVFTNLRPEHIEAHGSFEKYREAKGKLFKAVKNIHIVNLDDNNAEYFLRFPAKKKIGYGFKISKFQISNTNDQKIFAKNFYETPSGANFQIQNIDFSLKLVGGFNAYNALAAICVGLSEGVLLEISKKALEKINGLPGRMEVIIEKPFKVIVDLAHTPDSYEEVFNVVKKMPHNKIISIFGSAGGGRDKWKRPVLGKIAAKYSDFIILTNEDPYDENPLKIIEEIESGFSQIPNFIPQNAGPKYEKILDRREAIRKGLEMAKEGDIVLALGKGAEQKMVIGANKIPWDDREVVKEELKDKLNSVAILK